VKDKNKDKVLTIVVVLQLVFSLVLLGWDLGKLLKKL
jgi:hypothetical protein